MTCLPIVPFLEVRLVRQPSPFFPERSESSRLILRGWGVCSLNVALVMRLCMLPFATVSAGSL